MDPENDLDLADENSPLINPQPSSSGYRALSVSSASVPGLNASLQLSAQISQQLDSADPNSTPRHLVSNKEFKLEIDRRLKRHYPWVYVLISSVLVASLSAANIYIERIQIDRFEIDDFDVLSYRTLSGLALLAAAVNIFYSMLALLTIKFKRYFLIQLVALVNLIGTFMSFVYMIIFNIVVLVFSILGSQCDYTCITTRSFAVLFGVVVTILQLVFFVLIQLNFMRNVNSEFVLSNYSS